MAIDDFLQTPIQEEDQVCQGIIPTRIVYHIFMLTSMYEVLRYSVDREFRCIEGLILYVVVDYDYMRISQMA